VCESLPPDRTHHHPVAVLDHVEIGDRLADLMAQTLGQALALVLAFAGIVGHAGARLATAKGRAF